MIFSPVPARQHSKICGKARVYGYARVHGTAIVNSEVSSNAEEKPVEKTEQTPKAIWIETVCSHEVEWDNIPKSVQENLIEKGERGVRRTLAAWPHGMVLEHKVVHNNGETQIHWFWK